MNYINLIEFIQSLHPKFWAFHLAKCGGCDAPSYCQPCRICRYYPYDYDPDEIKRCSEYKLSAKTDFVKSINKHNNIVSWYISGYFDTCLFKPCPYTSKLTKEDFKMRYEFQKLYDDHKQISTYPSPEQIWKWVVEENMWNEYKKIKYGEK